MADFDNRVIRGQTDSGALAIDAGLRAYMLRVYNYMFMGLLLTAASAWVVADVPSVRELFFQYVQTSTGERLSLSLLGWVALLAPLALVFTLSWRIARMSLGAAQATFWIYAGVNGIALAPVLLLYTGADVTQAFLVTSATFGAMSLYGYTTKSDLSGWGSFLFMGLIGVIIASVVNMFIVSSTMSFVISVIGVLVFTGLTAYDTQWIKAMYVANDDGTVMGRKAIMGALKLYLDFINLFLMILRLLGTQRR